MLPLRSSRLLRQIHLRAPTSTSATSCRPILRTYADHASSSSNTRPTSSDPPRPPLKNNYPVILIGAVFLTLPFYYILHSDKSFNSGKQAIAEARKNGGGPATEYRDPRDSGVKTLEDKRRKEEGAGRR